MRPRILFLDAYDSFSNNITSLLTTLLDADVSVLPIDAPLSSSPYAAEREAVFRAELARYDAVVCGPGPGHPDNDADVGFMKHIWSLPDEDLLPVFGVCLGFQSLVAASGGKVCRLRRGLHGMVREIVHREGSNGYSDEGQDGRDIFVGVGKFRATLYHSLCGDVGQSNLNEDEWQSPAKWRPLPGCPDLLPLAWTEESREDGETERILMAVRHRNRPFWGVQYHPESVCTEEEGNRVILNWFREATKWNKLRGRVPLSCGRNAALARAATKPSLLSSLLPVGQGTERSWWESPDPDTELHAVTLPLPRGVNVPDIVEAVNTESSERLVLDSANASPATSRADVRGRYSIIAAGVDEALRIEHHTGDHHATVSVQSARGPRMARSVSVKLTEQVPLSQYGGIWGLLAAFHEARRIEPKDPAGPPFIGGFMGYITYEQGLSDIGISLEHPRPHRRPDICFAWVTKSVVVDHLLGVVHVQHLRSGRSETDMWLEKTASRLLSLQSPQSWSFDLRGEAPTPTKSRRGSRSTTIKPPLTKEYEAKVDECQEFIAAGESYELCLTDQTVITRPLSDISHGSGGGDHHGGPNAASRSPKQRRQSASSAPATAPIATSWQLFKNLRTRQPAPFASYLRLGGATLVSASPERFLQYDRSGSCSMRPMKGTVRKSEAVSTIEQAEAILHVPKEEAENLMIVDLVRHDLHGICGAGNVSVPRLLKVEEYQSVFQMITVVEGQLPTTTARPTGNGTAKETRQENTGYTGLDVLAASLPPGSMTGAPKKRSCEILQQIEGHQERGLYSGVVGYMCATGNGDWSVTIRSLFRWDDEQVVVKAAGAGEDEDAGSEEKHEVWRIGAGGAVTILSTPVGEREEMFTKLAGPLRVFAEG